MTTPSRGVGSVRNHRRFPLVEVTLDGATVGGATIDIWQNDAGATCWSARLLMVLRDGLTEGLLAGSMRDGRRIRGRVSLSGVDPALRARGPVLVEWHGTTALAEAIEPA